MKMIFRRINGKQRWFLKDSTGQTIAKFYQQPTEAFIRAFDRNGNSWLSDAAADYRRRVNVRCDAKGYQRVYAEAPGWTPNAD